MREAPYDERNKADYLDISNKLEIALNLIATDLTVPATEISLAKLAGCSRGTLRNRVYPLERLRSLKKLRTERQKRIKKSSGFTSIHRVFDESRMDEKMILRQQLDKSRNELAQWVNKCSDLEREVKKLRRMQSILLSGKKILEQRVDNLKSDSGTNNSC